MNISNNAELAENKLTLLYISKSAGMPITNTRLSQIITEGNFFNFFLLQHLLEDLITNNYLKKSTDPDGEHSYLITVKGSETLDFLIHKLPLGVRRHIEKLTSSKSDLIRQERNIISYIEPGKSGSFISILEIKDNDNLLFSIKYSSATKNDSIMISEKLKKNAEEIYAILTETIIK